MPKILRKLLVLATFGISMMTYMRASTEELSDESPSADKIAYLAILAFFAGICESLEVYDHLFPQESPEVHEDTSPMSGEVVPSSSMSKTAAIATAMAVAAPPLALCAWAHKLQGDELARSVGAEEKLWGLIFATPALVKFCAVAIPHLLHTLNGTRERYSLSVTNNEMKQAPEDSVPPLKWWMMLSVLIYLHLPEGNLIAAPIRDEIQKSLAAFGFALAESVPHLNQLEQLPKNIAALIKSRESSSLMSSALRVGAGAVGGFGSASEALLAAFVGTRGKATAWIAPLVEFVLGFAETQQHLVPSVQKIVQDSIFKSPKGLPDKLHTEISLGDKIQHKHLQKNKHHMR